MNEKKKAKVYLRQCIRCDNLFRGESKRRYICDNCNKWYIKRKNSRKENNNKEMNMVFTNKKRINKKDKSKTNNDLLKFYKYIYICKDCKSYYGRDTHLQNPNKNCGKCKPRFNASRLQKAG